MGIWLTFQGMVFALWAFWAFRCLFRIRAYAVAETGQSMPGLVATLRSFRAFLRLPEFRRDRLILLALTFALWLLILGFMILIRPSL